MKYRLKSRWMYWWPGMRGCLIVLICFAGALNLSSLGADGDQAAKRPAASPKKERPATKKVKKKGMGRDVKSSLQTMTPSTLEGRYLVLDLSAEANDHFGTPIGKHAVKVGEVPFKLPQGDKNCLSLRQAGWATWQQDFPWSYENAYPKDLKAHDPRMPFLKVPLENYTVAHVLAVADDDPGLSPAFTLRMGRLDTGGNKQSVQFDFAGRVPRRSDASRVESKNIVKTSGENLFYVRVPLPYAFAQDLLESPLQIEVTKEVRLARHSPDPNRFRYRPLGLPSGVRIAAITLEISPLQMSVTSDESANAFLEPKKPVFKVALKNITSAAQPYAIKLRATSLDGTQVDLHQEGKIEAGQTGEKLLTVNAPKRGYYDLAVTLEDGNQQVLLRRETSFAVLPPDTRKHRDQSPFGAYSFGGSNGSSKDMNKIGSLFVKLGMRYGMFGNIPEIRKKYGLVKGNEPNIASKKAVGAYEEVLAWNPDLPPMALVFHETAISGRNMIRVPDILTDRPPFQLEDTLHETKKGAVTSEKAKFDDLWALALSVTKEMRAKHPEVSLALGNDMPGLQEEFLKHKFPSELFDTLGNESPSYCHLPESQPPDCLGNNSTLWIQRQLLDTYGYRDKPLSQCHEVCYPSTNPGNLDCQTQADYFVRHAVHSLAWGIPAFRPGVITDVFGCYRWSNWGAAGFCRMPPEMNVKPAFVAFATLTLMLDGAKFTRDVPLGSPTLYGAEFSKQDGLRVIVLWTVRGERPLTLSLAGAGHWKWVDDQDHETPLNVVDGKVKVKLTTSPAYLVGKGQITGAAAGTPVYRDQPEGKVSPLSPLDNLKDWTVEEGRNIELEYYNPFEPRRKGDFAFETVAGFEGKSGVIRVTPKPLAPVKETLAMPIYGVVAHKQGILVPGTPTEIGLWVNGNSGWGRVIFELTDASGQRWISLGAQSASAPETFFSKEVLDQFKSPGISDWNTDDAWGVSRINFDGWRYVAFPLPGNYPGEQYKWPANSQWRWDKDGVVHYPFTLKKIVVELNEKVLHMKTYAPVPRPEIYLKDLVVGQGDTLKVKQTVAE